MATNNLIGPDLLTTCTNANSLLMLKKLLSRFTKDVFHHHFDQHKSREQQWRSVMPSSHIKLIVFMRWEPLMAPQWRNYQLDIFILCTNLVSWGHLEDRCQLKNHKRSKLVLIIITFSLWMLTITVFCKLMPLYEAPGWVHLTKLHFPSFSVAAQAQMRHQIHTYELSAVCFAAGILHRKWKREKETWKC